MQLPILLSNAIEHEAALIGFSALTKAASALSDSYRFRQSSHEKLLTTEAQRIAYIATRMPATYAAIRAVLQEIKKQIPKLSIQSLVDLGAGPGTSAWAAIELFDELQSLLLIERDLSLMNLGQRLAKKSLHQNLINAQWIEGDIKTLDFPSGDAIIASYSLGEISVADARKITKSAWEKTNSVLIIIEPGSVKGFELIRTLRDDLIQFGGHIIAPCPHSNSCPVAENDWCHFAKRVERSSLHRKLKSGTLNYEDEKYSYFAVSKFPLKTASARVIRRPQISSGLVKLSLCKADGINEISLYRKDRFRFKLARKSSWGDSIDFSNLEGNSQK
jgi:ribosomal protein RSM22 (predicted rRNA methylase)